MTDWKEVGIFATGEANEIQFEFRVTGITKHPATVKSRIGSQLVISSTFGPTLTDSDLQIEIYLFGTKKSYINAGLTLTQEETRLVALRDQSEHPFDIGKYSGNYILSELNEDIEHNNNHTDVKKYNCVFLHKQI